MSERLQKAVVSTIEAGYQFDKDAFAFLETLAKIEDPVGLMERIVNKIDGLEQKPLYITRDFIEQSIIPPKDDQAQASRDFPTPLESKRQSFRPYAQEVEPDVKLLDDPGETTSTTGDVGEYQDYFLDRFNRIEKFLRQRMDVKDATSIQNALKASSNSKVKIIGMLSEKRDSKQRTFLRLEDQHSSVTVLVYPDLEGSVRERVQSLLLDQVVCISAVKARNDLLILEDIYYPEIPEKKPKRAPEPVYAALISDLHIGSKQFMREEFNRFLLWLNGKFGDSNWREIASHVKYVVIAGDIVDGIGIYPQQVKELAVRDIHRQYSVASRYLEQIPDYIKVVISPGNHDASRKALPQPSIPKDYAEPLHETHDLTSVGNPCTLSLHGVELLLYHGRSLDDVVASGPNMSPERPEKSMRLLLQCRHLAPIYGQRTPIAPGKRDSLVIDRVPDIFHAGHVHVYRHDKYRGVLIVNSGAWQQQTEYMRRMGLRPTPGIAPVVNLQTLQLMTLDFTSH